MKTITKIRLAHVAMIITSVILWAVRVDGQEIPTSKVNDTDSDQVQVTRVVLPDLSANRATLFSTKAARSDAAIPASPQGNDDDSWHMEIRPYVWAAGIYGRLRVRNTTADTGQSSASVLGMLDFAAAVQVEAKKNRWSLMFDENYVNLGTTASGPLGVSSVEVEPTLNLFEFGLSYEFARVANNDATSSDPLPPVFSAEVLGGGRYVHFGLELEPQNLPTVEGSRNLVGAFIGNRVKASPHKAVTLIGKYTVGFSGVGSQFAWSADALVDFRLNKKFSLGGGYRWLGLNADDSNNVVGFDGHLRGLIFTATLYH